MSPEFTLEVDWDCQGDDLYSVASGNIDDCKQECWAHETCSVIMYTEGNCYFKQQCSVPIYYGRSAVVLTPGGKSENNDIDC